MSISEVMTIFVSIDEILFCVDYEGQIALYCIVRIFSAIDIHNNKKSEDKSKFYLRWNLMQL